MHFTIDSDEGLPIRGNLDAPANPRALAVVVHGFKGYKDWGFFPWMAETLCDHHLAVCRFNMSRSGIGENLDAFDRLDLFRDDTYSVQLADLHTVVRHCRTLTKAPLFLLGHSRGGGVALLAAPDLEGLCGVATWNPISYLIEGFRSLFISGWDGTALWRGFAVAIGLGVVALLAVAGALRTRMQRT